VTTGCFPSLLHVKTETASASQTMCLKKLKTMDSVAIIVMFVAHYHKKRLE